MVFVCNSIVKHAIGDILGQNRYLSCRSWRRAGCLRLRRVLVDFVWVHVVHHKNIFVDCREKIQVILSLYIFYCEKVFLKSLS